MTGPEIIHCEQRSAEWYAARLGRPTASEFSSVMAGGDGKTRMAYMRKLAGEIVTGEPMESFSNSYMERGTALEPEARAYYQLSMGTPVQEVGFVVAGRTGCSPDGFVGEDGMVEFKIESPHLLIERMESGAFPTEHMAQLQGNLWCCQRQWIDLVHYYPKLPMWRRRVKRDPSYIARLEVGVAVFCEELDRMVDRVRKYKQ